MHSLAIVKGSVKDLLNAFKSWSADMDLHGELKEIHDASPWGHPFDSVQLFGSRFLEAVR